MKKISSGLVVRFLNWLETDRKSSISTRNLRLTAIHSFFRYMQSESLESLYPYQKVLAIPVQTGSRYYAVMAHSLSIQVPGKYGATGKFKVVWKQQSGICPLCVESIDLAEKRKIRFETPRKMGGTDHVDNMIYVHKDCEKLFAMAAL